MIVRLVILLLASAAPVAFPAAQLGYASLHDLALFAVTPSIVALAVVWWIVRRRTPDAAAIIAQGAAAGALATLALEAVRYSGFRLGFMPGNLPRLMGVLLLDRFALGPSTASDLAGFASHFWNGAAFGIVFLALVRKPSTILAIGYGIAIGLGFLVSPVVQSLGVGIFGRDFGPSFAMTVLSAHSAFGAVLGLLLRRWRPTADASSTILPGWLSSSVRCDCAHVDGKREHRYLLRCDE